MADTFEIKRHAKLAMKHLMVKHELTRKMLDLRYRVKKEPLNRRRRETYFALGPKVAQEVSAALWDAGVQIWLYAGSLLGVVRDGDFLPWDDDLDFCVLADEGFDWRKVENVLTQNGFEKIREFECDGVVTEQTYASGDCYFDLFSFMPYGDDRAYVCIYEKSDYIWYKDRDHFTVLFLDTFIPTGLKWVDVRGCMLPIPENAEQLLEKQYGSSWRVPNPDYVDGSAYTILEGAEGRTSLFIR